MAKNKEEINYLEVYLERKIEEINKFKKQLESFNSEREDCIKTKISIEKKIVELSDKDTVSESNEKHIKSLKRTLESYRNDIMRLTVEITSTEDILEDLEFDYEMTTEELNILKNIM